jgi:hypothetical protein
MKTDYFLNMYIENVERQSILKDLLKKKCELIGVVGRNAFHIFDKTNLTWFCSIKALGYETLI